LTEVPEDAVELYALINLMCVDLVITLSVKKCSRLLCLIC